MTPAVASRSCASPARSASHFPGSVGREPADAWAARRDGERLEHVFADLERARPDADPEPGVEIAGAAVGRFAQAGDRRFEHARGKPAPARMGRGDASAEGRGEQDGQAVGHLHRAGDAPLGRQAGVGLVRRRFGEGVGGADPDDPPAVHLAQEDRGGAAGDGKSGPVGGDPLRQVADGGAEVHRGERAVALPAFARRHQGADASVRPGGNEPARRPAHVASGQADAWVVLNAASAMQFS
jgi:hypothetical protein